MSKKNRKNRGKVNIGIGRVCRKCGVPTVIRKRTQAPKIKTFYYTQWEFCEGCNAVYFEEKYKSGEWQENERQMSFFNSLKKSNE